MWNWRFFDEWGIMEAKPFVEVAKAAKAGLCVTVREYVVSRRCEDAGENRGCLSYHRPCRLQVQRLLAPLVESKLRPEQAQRHRQECDKRAESRKRTVVLNLIAALDERLVLTAEQRARLVHSLSAKYRDPPGTSTCRCFLSTSSTCLRSTMN